MTTMPLAANPCIAFFEANGATLSQQSATKSVASLVSEVGNFQAIQTGATSTMPTLNIDTRNKLRGYTELDFDGTQFLTCNDVASALNDTSLSMAVVAACSDPTGGPYSILSLGHSSGTSKIDLFVNGSTDISITITNAAGVASTTAASLSPVLDTAAHCYTVLFDKTAGTLKVRFDAVEVISVGSISGTFTLNRFTIGALTTSSTSRQFKGTIGPVAMYLGAAGLKLQENYLGAKFVSGAFAF